jgi:hypothetical protein
MALVIVTAGGGDQLDGQLRGQQHIPGAIQAGLFEPPLGSLPNVFRHISGRPAGFG